MDRSCWKLSLAVLVLLVSAHAHASFSCHMKDFIEVVKQLEGDKVQSDPLEVLKSLRLVAVLNDTHISQFLPDGVCEGACLDPNISRYLQKVVNHHILDNGQEEGVVLTPDGTTLALAPLLLDLEVSLLSKISGHYQALIQSTLARDLATALTRDGGEEQLFGSNGCWDNPTSPQVFTHSRGSSKVTSAQVYGGMDGVILGRKIASTPKGSLTLSGLLTEYYLHQLDSRGMDGAPGLISQRRRENFRRLVNPSVLVRETLNAMKAKEKMSDWLVEVDTAVGLMTALQEVVQEFMQIFTVCPPIISRCSWGAAPYIGTPTNLSLPMSYLFIHHTYIPSQPCLTFEQCAADMRSMQDFHQHTNGWDDIGYSFVAGSDGNIYEGRGWNWQGAHTKGYNNVGYGVSFIGDYTSSLPTQHSMALVRDQLAACAVLAGRLRSSYLLKGHRQMVNTSCPGDALYDEIKTWKHFQE